MQISETINTPAEKYSFLSGGGDMGKLIRAKDWSKTPLGDPANWPQSLRTMISVMLDNPFGMYIAWGKEYTQIYNDAYRPILGSTKHPQALGISTRETFSEIWHIIDSMFDGVMDGTPVGFPDFELPLNRNGYVELCYFDFSYSPIRKEDGEVGGVLVTVIETTNKKRAETDLLESNNQLAFAIDATELGTFDFDPATRKFLGNERLKKWFGLSAENEIELEDAIKSITEKDQQRVIEAINKVLDYSSGGLYDITYTIVHPVSKKERVVKAKGKAWFNDDKVAYRFNGTLQDITEQYNIEKIIAESERNLRLMILQAPVAIGILRGKDYVIEIANKRALELWGRSEEEILDKPAFESMPELLDQGIKELLDDVYNTGNRFAATELPVELLRKGAIETVYINFSYEALYNAEGNINGIMAIGFEVTEQVLTRQKVEASEHNIRTLVESAPFPIGVYTGREMRITLANESILDVMGKGNDVIGKLYSEVLPELENQEIFQQLDNVYTSGIPFHEKNKRVELLIDGKLQSYYFNYSFTPLYDIKGEVYGVMNTAAEVTDINLVNNRLAESEKRFRNSVQQAPLGIAIFRAPDYIAELANETYLQLVDKPEDEFIGVPLFQSLPEVKDLVEPLFQDVISSGKAFHASELPVLLHRFGRKELGYFNFVYHPLKDDNNTISGIMVVATEVTESVKAKQSLEEREKHFRNMVMQSPIAMTILRGEDHVIEMANAMMVENMWKKNEEEVIGKKILDVFPELKEQKYPELLKKVYKDGEVHRENEALAYVQHTEGLTKFYLDFEYAPLYDTEGLISGIMATVSDVTDKVEARKKVEEAEERMRLATEAAELATWDLDLKTGSIIHSQKLAEIFGHKKINNFSHQELRNQIHPDDKEAIVEKAFEKAMETGVYFYEARVVKPDENICWVRTKGKVFYDENKEPHKIIGTIRDITEEKIYRQELEEREQKFRVLADFMPQFVWTGDAEGNLNYFNQAVYDYSGHTPEQIEKEGWIQIVHPDEREENIKVWEEAITYGKDFSFEHRFRRADGVYRWQLSRAIPLRDAYGFVQMWVGTSTDIHNIKEQDQQKDYFISMASHELKTPITSIKGYVQILKAMYNGKEDNFLTNSLNVVDKQIVTLTNLISDLLDVSKIKIGGLAFNTENFEIAELINDKAKEIKNINPEYKIEVSAEKNIQVNADRDRIGQVLINFLTNAIKYAPNSNVIKIKSLVRENQVVVSVEDKGIGISKKDQERIFERFYRVEGKNENTFPGFGIGLFIAAEIIKRHNGTTSVESQPGEGSVFSFSLPLK